MYSAILRKIPIPTFFKVVLVLLILAGITAFCFLEFFPWLADQIPFPFGNAGYPEAPANLQIIEGSQ